MCIYQENIWKHISYGGHIFIKIVYNYMEDVLNKNAI